MNNTQIRKVSVGNGHPDQMMHYQVGKVYTINNKQFELTDILLVQELLEKGILAYHLYVFDGEVRLLWKTLINLPMVIENNISFE
jgi:hypothetical protein